MYRKLKRNRQRVLWTLLVTFNVVVVYNTIQVAWMDADQHKTYKRQLVRGLANVSTGGYMLASHVREQCGQRGHYYPLDTVRLDQVYTTTSEHLQLCPVWKVGTTFLKRVFMLENLKQYNNVTNPYSIGFSERYDGNVGFMSNIDTETKKFMFARNPYQRLLSSYVDKLLAPNPVYWRLLGIPAIKGTRTLPSEQSIKCGHDLTFGEFIKYVTIAMDLGRPGVARRSHRKVGVVRDLHFEQLTVICKPCHIKYDFVGKMESFKEDSLELMTRMNLTAVAKLMESNGGSFAVEDAIRDTVYQPFHSEFRKEYLPCITEREAMQRAWRKLQTRGLIGNQKLELTDAEAEQMTHEELLQLAHEARAKSTQEERKQVKRDFYIDSYRSVSREDLEKISRIYENDFDLFDYNSRPSDIFTW